MKKEDVGVIAQLLTGIKDAIEKLEEAQKHKDAEGLELARREILNFQRKIDGLLR
jgi:hypothetical protein